MLVEVNSKIILGIETSPQELTEKQLQEQIEARKTAKKLFHNEEIADGDIEVDVPIRPTKLRFIFSDDRKRLELTIEEFEIIEKAVNKARKDKVEMTVRDYEEYQY